METSFESAESVRAGWWDAVVITASSSRQAGAYRSEIERRLVSERVPKTARYIVVPDVNDTRMGSGSATIHALGVVAREFGNPPASWWRESRVLMIHSGGDSRRLPQYSPSGKLFGVLPVAGVRGEASTIFDETMASSTEWMRGMPGGVLAAAGDVLLSFGGTPLAWGEADVMAVAMPQDVETGSQHGVYVVDDAGCVLRTLQKPSLEDLKTAGALLPDGRVALDTGLLWFSSELAHGMASLNSNGAWPELDLYEHVTAMFTGQWPPRTEAGPLERRMSELLRGARLRCAVVNGQFTHIGTTRHFRAVAARSSGAIDSALGGALSIWTDAVVLECEVEGSLRAGRGSIAHGLYGIAGPVEIPENTVVHQLPVCGDGVVIRVYSVDDNPKVTDATGTVTWLGRPISEVLEGLGIDDDSVWPDVAPGERSLWNAQLFPVASPGEAWQCARWMLGYAGAFGPHEWEKARRTSLAAAASMTDHKALDAARERRRGRARQELLAAAADLRRRGPLTEAASRYMQASVLLLRAGKPHEAEAAEREAFQWVAEAVAQGTPIEAGARITRWRCDEVTAAAPARVDLAGGWSDTPPFCIDWGGCVLNAAVEWNGGTPVLTRARRLDERVVRCISGDAVAEYRDAAQICAPAAPGDWTAIPRLALRLLGFDTAARSLEQTLESWGGGVEIVSQVRLPMGSGLGASSILAATVIRAMAALGGVELTDAGVSDLVLRLEQMMTAGGGWQDQAGGIYPGVKLLVSAPGAIQRIEVQPLAWDASRQAEFESRAVLYDTGIQRIAKNLLQQVVRSYLLRNRAAIEVLHGVKILAAEMAAALCAGEWDCAGTLLSKQWELNKRLDPNTSNAAIETILSDVAPYVSGAKLAGAGGGGFLVLLARDPDAAAALRARLGPQSCGLKIAGSGLVVR